MFTELEIRQLQNLPFVKKKKPTNFPKGSKSIYDFVKLNPGSSEKTIYMNLKISATTANKYLGLLIDKEKIKKSKNNGVFCYFVK